MYPHSIDGIALLAAIACVFYLVRGRRRPEHDGRLDIRRDQAPRSVTPRLGGSYGAKNSREEIEKGRIGRSRGEGGPASKVGTGTKGLPSRQLITDSPSLNLRIRLNPYQNAYCNNCNSFQLHVHHPCQDVWEDPRYVCCKCGKATPNAI